MKYSMKKQFAYIFIGLMAGTILLCWFINNTFLEKYYIQNKQHALLRAYRQIEEANRSGNIASEAFDIELQKVSSKYNISVLLLDANSKTLMTTSNNPDLLAKQLLEHIFLGVQGKDKILLESETYVIQNTMDERTHTEYIEMWGMLENGNLFLLRTALEGIRESVGIANRFLAYVGFFSVLLGAVFISFVAKKVTEPIMELAAISEKMTNLEFEAKYTGKSKNEVALLGHHINQLSETLEKTISELKTANYELQQDIEKKKQIDEMRKEFLSNVSHELKTPIALIQGYAEGLAEGIHEDEESKNFYCEVIMDEASKMNEMVKKLMTLNQLESGNEVVQLERFNLIDLIRNTIQSTEILMKQNQIMVQMPDIASVYVWADEFQIEEVFRNYFVNAINHAMEEKIIRVKIEEKEKTVRVSVFNSGKPIPEEAIPFIWDKFYKVDKARTREYGGSGVGLSIVKAIMESMKQEYGVCNYSDGVEFWFELPTV